jgi:RNA polymerase sigma factor (sigma-70 family)
VSDTGEFDRRTWFVREILMQETRLRAILRRFFPKPVDLADGIQEAYARLLCLPDGDLARIRSPAAFLVRVARNVAVEWTRKRRLMPRDALTELRLVELPDNGPSALEVLSRREELDLLNRAIAALPERCRKVLVLRRLQGFSQKEIAVQLGISENTVEKHASNGLRLCTTYCTTERARGMRRAAPVADSHA